ncbi:hypothetical protein [Streptomyces sp. UNOC14_S4]|uniref:hypothetical protein n=1 Tax=Streptomyces sp. UNOC14_S4 TaxID=2872340 RepID=UPI0035B1DC7E
MGARCSAPVSVYAEWASDEMLRVLVQDGAPGLPLRYAHSEYGEVGRGLLLVRRCAFGWGVCQHGSGPGKAVWFTLVG